VIWIFVVVGALLVFAVAAAFVGTETFRLGHETPAAIFDMDEAVDAVADALPEAAQARLTYDEVRAIIQAVLAHLRQHGVGALPGEEPALPAEDDVVIDDDHALAAALVEIEAAGLDVADADAAAVTEALMAHLAAIGALGPRA